MTNPHALLAPDDTALNYNELLGRADKFYNKGNYAKAVRLYEQAERLNGINDDVRAQMLIRKARSLRHLARFEEMQSALDEAWDIAQAQGLIGLIDEIHNLK
jgi:tetratricopeptide (TPR) repeat protein